jgi:hypothetical protein
MCLGRRADRPEAATPWYAVAATGLYRVTVGGKPLEPMLGDSLMRGIDLAVGKEPVGVVVEPLPGPPYGGHALILEAPPAVGGDGPIRVPITLRNETGYAQEVLLKTSFGEISPGKLSLAMGKSAEAVLTADLRKPGHAVIEVTSAAGKPITSHTIHLVHGKNLVGFKAFDDQEYKGTPYLWCGRKPIDFALPAKPGKPHTLHLLWGSKRDERKAKVVINGRAQELSQGGYVGFKWLTIPIPAELVKKDTVKIRIERLAPAGAAFISQAKLTSP